MRLLTKLIRMTKTFNGIFFSIPIVAIILMLIFNKHLKKPETEKQQLIKLKYILIWYKNRGDPLLKVQEGQKVFIRKKCKEQKCFLTKNKRYFKDIRKFDVLLFNWPAVVSGNSSKLPPKRTPNQNYVIACMESSAKYPICNNKFDGYFNVTCTYKLDSDIFYAYIIVRNKEGKVIGPKKEMHWISFNEMKPVNDTIKTKLRSKKKLAAWLVSRCNAPSGRTTFVQNVQKKLNRMGNRMTVDVYGACGKPCKRSDMPKCLKMIEKDYFFYFSFENSFAEDYVTEKILHALKNYAVPVVYGSANYTRFLPDGSYLNAIELGADTLAEKMVEIANDKEKYYKYFRWMNHYSFHSAVESPETDYHCKFCEAMNNDKLMNKRTVIQNFKKWWNPSKIWSGVSQQKEIC